MERTIIDDAKLREMQEMGKHFPDEGGRVVDALVRYLRAYEEPEDNEKYRDARLAGHRDYILEYPFEVPSYEYDFDKMKIHDPVWGECEIGKEPYDTLLLELAKTPLFMRLQAVEQLTFSGEFSTVPNTSEFSRWQHIWGSLVFVRKMTEGDIRFSERERIVLQLRTLFSDVGQTSFSHLGDWLFQGLEGGEDLHDKDLHALLETSGIEKMLAKYDLTLDETVFPDVEDWVECPSPALCVDRVDYGLREMFRWACPPSHVNMFHTELHNPKSLFEITDSGELAITNLKFAREFAVGYSLLASDNWSHPTHRVMMELMLTAMRDALVRKTRFSGIHPRELMYGVDYDFYDYFLKWGGASLGDMMRQIALDQRRIFTVARKPELEGCFEGVFHDDKDFPDFPDPLAAYSWKSKEFGKNPLPAQLTVKEVEHSGSYMKATKQGLEIGLPHLKPRRVDPLVITSDGPVKLSVFDPSYGRYIAQSDALVARSFRATIHMRKDVAKKLAQKYEDSQEEWQEACKRPRKPNFLKRVIGSAAFTALGYKRSFDTHAMSDDYRLAIDTIRAQGIIDWTDVQLSVDD